MISGLARAGSGLGVKEYTERAIQAAHFIQAHLQSQVSRKDILTFLYLPIFHTKLVLYGPLRIGIFTILCIGAELR
jgi:hypothetical protein